MSNLTTLLVRWEEAFERGQDLPAGALCPDSPELAAELQHAIDALRKMNALVAGPLATRAPSTWEGNSPPTAGPAPDGDSPATVAPTATEAKAVGGTAIPGYETLEEIGRGGMGVVYKARQVGLNRVVALKMILAGGHAGEEELARFRTEAEAVARLQHPNIVQVFEVGEVGGHPFLALEFCPGGGLDKKLAGTPIDPREAAKLVESLARGMHAAHEAKVIHRDLKPANVLLAADGTPKVTDFGLAKKIDEAGQTQTGAVMGTPSYMAPEQAEGKKELGPACDVYALGAILYECLTGRPPFKAATVMDTLMQVVTQEPVPPRELNAKVPRDLETICLKCLRKEVGKRYGSAAELAEDLRRFEAGEPIKARRMSGRERIRRWAWRNPLLATVEGIALALFAGALIAAGLLYRQSEELARESEERERQSRMALYGKQFDRALLMWSVGDVEGCRELMLEMPADLAGWEWDWLQQLCEREKSGGDLETHRWPGGSSVTPITQSRDGRSIAYGVRNRVIVGDLGTGEVLVPWSVPMNFDPDFSRNQVVFAADGKTFLTFGTATNFTYAVTSHDSKDGRELKRWIFGVCPGHKAILSPDGRHGLGAPMLSSNGTSQVLQRVADGQGNQTTVELRSKVEDRQVFQQVRVFSPDGKRVAMDTYRGSWQREDLQDPWLEVWDTETGKPLQQIRNNGQKPQHAEFSLDGKYVAIRWEQPSLELWDVEAGKVLGQIKKQGRWPEAVSFCPNGKHVAIRWPDSSFDVWDLRTGKQLRQLAPDGGHEMLWSLDGRWIVDKYRIYDCEQDARFQGDPRWGKPRRAGRDERGRQFFVADGRDGNLFMIWDFQTRQPLANLKCPDQPPNWPDAHALSPTGNRLVAVGSGRLVIWDVATGKTVLDVQDHQHAVRRVAFSAEGDRILSTDGYSVRLRDRRRPAVSSNWEPGKRGDRRWFGDHVQAVQFGSDGMPLAWLFEDLSELRRVDSGERLNSWTEESDRLWGFNRDGRLLASYSPGQGFSIWDGERKRQLSLDTEGERVVGFQFSHDGKRFAFRTKKDVVRVFEVGTDKPLLHEEVKRITAMTFSEDGKLFALATASEEEVGLDRLAGTAKGEVRVFDLSSRRPSGTVRTNKSIATLLLTPDNKRVVVGWSRGGIRTDFIRRLEGGFTSDPKKLFSTGDTHGVAVLDVATGQELLALTPLGVVGRMEFTSGGRHLIVADTRGDRVNVYSAAAPGEVRTLRGHTEGVQSLSFSHDGARLVSCGKDKKERRVGKEAKIWEVASGREIRSLAKEGALFSSVAFDPSGDLIATADPGYGGLMVHRDEKGKIIKTERWNGSESGWQFNAQSKETRYWYPGGRPNRTSKGSPPCPGAVKGSRGGLVRIWDARTGRQTSELAGHYGSVESVKFSPDGRSVASVCTRGRVIVWDPRTGGEKVPLPQDNDDDGLHVRKYVAFTGDNLLLAGRKEGEKAGAVWDLNENAIKHTVDGIGKGEVPTIACDVTPDGAWIAGLGLGSLRVWNVKTGNTFSLREGGLRYVDYWRCLAFDPSGNYLVAGAEDRTVQIWSIPDWQLVRALRGHAGPVTSVAFSPDGRYLASGSEDRLIKIWDVSDLPKAAK